MNDEPTETEPDTVAKMLLDAAEPEQGIVFVAVVVLTSVGDEAKLGFARANFYKVDASVATPSGCVTPTFGTACKVLRDLADAVEKDFDEAGFESLSLSDVSPPSGAPS